MSENKTIEGIKACVFDAYGRSSMSIQQLENISIEIIFTMPAIFTHYMIIIVP